VLPGYSMDEYSVSKDGKQVAFVRPDEHGRSSLWIAPTNRRSSPVRISSSEGEDSVRFLPGGDLIVRALEGGSNFIYRMKADGTGRTKINSEAVLDVFGVSPDGQWVAANAPDPDPEHMVATKAFAVEGGKEEKLCVGFCKLYWDVTGKFALLYIQRQRDVTYVVPTLPDSGLPKLPPGGKAATYDMKSVKPVAVIPSDVKTALSPSVYAYTQLNTRRNLYRIQLP